MERSSSIWLLFCALLSSVWSRTIYHDCLGCMRFPLEKSDVLVDAKQILIDSKQDQIIVAARGCVLRLDPRTLTLSSRQNDYIKLTPQDSNIKQCIASGKNKDVCHNYFQLLLMDTNQKIFACGTNACNPTCWRFNRTGSLSPIPANGIEGETRSPELPNQNVTGVFFSHPTLGEYLFTGIHTAGTRSTIYRTTAKNSIRKYLSTEGTELFLKDANFVSSYHISDDFIYFFLRETAIEDKSKAVYSRVARVCPYDSGGEFVLKNKFTSFTKTRLLCAMPGDVAFNYDQIQSTYKYTGDLSNDVFMYGTFTTPENGIAGSAVCVYPLKGIHSVFSTSKYLEEKTVSQQPLVKAWVTTGLPQNITDPGRPKCTPDLKTQLYDMRVTKFAKGHPLLADTVQPSGGKPVFIRQGVRFTQIVVDKVEVVYGPRNRTIPVMFVGTDNGTVYKVFLNPATQQATVLEQIDVIKTQEAVYSMKLYRDGLYIGSKSSVTRVPTHHCNQHKTCRTCILAQDPYCGWSNKRCVTKHSAGSPWAQDIANGNYTSVCPKDLPSCVITMVKENPGGETILECQANGIPVPWMTGWSKDSAELSYGGEYTLKNTGFQDSQRLVIAKFGVQNLGVYTCTVKSEVGKEKCSLSVKGTLPSITSGFTKHIRKSYFWCQAKGIPKPTVAIYKVIRGINIFLNANNVSINGDMGTRAYYCVAQNEFGPAIGRNFTIEERKLKAELRLTKESWSSKLQDVQSMDYKTLAGRVEKEVNMVYQKYATFLGITEMTFRSGSVVSEMTLRFAVSPSDEDQTLYAPLQDAVDRAELGALAVDSKHQLYKYDKPGPTSGYRGGSEGVDSGLFAVAILVAIVLSVLLGFLVGLKFHSRAINSCRRADETDTTPSNKHKNVKHIKYSKSPPKVVIESELEDVESRQKLLRRNPDGEEAKTEEDKFVDIDFDSDGSAGGKIQTNEVPSSPVKTPQENGRVPKTIWDK